MRIKPEQLPEQLSRSLAPVYLIVGSETLLVQESRDLVIKAAHAQGFDERDTFQVVGRYDWSEIAESSKGTMSLFSSRRIVDIRIPTSKPGRDGAKHLTDMVETPDPDTLIIVSGGDWTNAIKSTKWAKTLDTAGVLVEIWPIKAQELPGWINARLRRAGLNADADAVSLLAQLVEGNLLAAQQEIEKLIMVDCQRLTVNVVKQAVADSSRFNGFRLNECMLMGDLADSLRVAAGLKRTGVVIQIVIASLHGELSVLSAARSATAAGEREDSFFKRMRIWPQRQAGYRRALGRLTADKIDGSFRLLALMDRQGKGMAAGDPWMSLDRFLLDFCGRPG